MNPVPRKDLTRSASVIQLSFSTDLPTSIYFILLTDLQTKYQGIREESVAEYAVNCPIRRQTVKTQRLDEEEYNLLGQRFVFLWWWLAESGPSGKFRLLAEWKERIRNMDWVLISGYGSMRERCQVSWLFVPIRGESTLIGMNSHIREMPSSNASYSTQIILYI